MICGRWLQQLPRVVNSTHYSVSFPVSCPLFSSFTKIMMAWSLDRFVQNVCLLHASVSNRSTQSPTSWWRFGILLRVSWHWSSFWPRGASNWMCRIHFLPLRSVQRVMYLFPEHYNFVPAISWGTEITKDRMKPISLTSQDRTKFGIYWKVGTLMFLRVSSTEMSRRCLIAW